MKVDLGLQVAANAFIDALTPIVESARRARGAPTDEVRIEVVREAFDLACAFIDADGRAADTELWALIVAFAPVLDRDLLDETPDSLRAAATTEGRRAFLDQLSPLFEELVAADERDHTTWTTTYYQHAVALGFMTASLDDYTSRDELIAIEHYRTMLLRALRTGHRSDGSIIEPSATGEPEGQDADAPDAVAARPTSTGQPVTDDAPPKAEAAPTGTAAPTNDELPPPRPIDDLLAELDRLVGLDAVKREVKLVTDLLRVQQLRRERGLDTTQSSHHLIFTGNPGTGKTTVARLIAQIYRTLGVVTKGQLVETDRSGLVAGFVGQTAPLVVAAFDRADQGVLLIDEAYALVRGTDSDFGREAIDTIVKLVEDRRDRVVVIAAGYPDEMQLFIDANPGLSSRFPTTIEFPDYDDDELVAIFKSQCDRAHYLLDADAEAKLRRLLAATPRTKGFGNGRLVRNLFEDAVARQASRVIRIKDPSDIDLVLLLEPDMPDTPPS